MPRMGRWPSPSGEFLAIVPPYAMDCPPAGIAMLNGYLVENGRQPLDVIDFRLWAPAAYAPTYRAIGQNSEAYVMDVPDLPLVLELLAAHQAGRPPSPMPGSWFLDYTLERGIDASHLANWLTEIDRYLDAVTAEVECHFIGFSVWTSNYYSTLLAAAYLKRRKNPPFIVLGGPQVTESQRSAALALKSGLADAVIFGEGEQAFMDLIDAFRDGRADEHTPGSTRWYNGALQTSPRPLLRMTNLPVAYFDNMPLISYQGPYRPDLVVPFQLSRGCTDKCSFCSEWVFWEKFRLAKVEQVLDQVEELIDRYKATRLRMVDSLLNGTARHLHAFADGLLTRGINVRWSGFLRADLDDELANLMTRSGFVHAFVGIESLDDATLADMNKRRTANQNIAAVTTMLRAGISVRAGVIPGYPGDTVEGFSRTVKGLLEIKQRYPQSFSAGMEPFIVSPGQPLFANLKEHGLIGASWPDNIKNLAPDMTDILDGCLETVSGRNQGKTRRHMLEALAPLEDEDSFWPAEEISSGIVEYFEVASGVWLARIKCETWGLRGWLMTAAEHGAAKLASCRDADLHRNGVYDFFELLERRHIAVANAKMAGWPHRYSARIDGLTGFRLGPTTVLRDFGSAVVLADYQTFAATRLDGANRQHLLDVFKHGDPTGLDEAKLALLDALAERGLLNTCTIRPSHALPDVSAETSPATPRPTN